MFWLASTFLGLSFIFYPKGKPNGDGMSYAQALENLHDDPISWGSFFDSFYDPGGGFLDLYQPIITYTISIFTGNPQILFFAFSLVLGFFFTRNIWFVIEKLQTKNNHYEILLLTALFLIIPIWSINGVRMWTAAHVFLYGLLPYLFDNDKSKIKWVYISFIFHFSFFIPISLLLVYMYMPKRITWPFLLFYVFSLFISEIDLELARNIGYQLPAIFHKKVTSYTSDAYAEKISLISSQNTIALLSNAIYKWGIAIILLFIFVKERTLLHGFQLYNTAVFLLISLGFANVINNIPSGNRFVTLFNFIALAFVLLYYEKIRQYKVNPISKQLINFLSVLLIISLFMYLRTPTVFYGFGILTNPIVVFFIENKESFYHIITGN